MMYNFLVTAAKGAWDLHAYEFDKSRFLEFTADTIKARYSKLTARNIENIKSCPTLFAYEGDDEDVKVGYIRAIRERGRSILIEYEFDEAVKPFTFSQINGRRISLDIAGGELSRTHWAIKDEDLFSILSPLGLIDSRFLPTATIGRVEEIQFKVAVSFAGEHRVYVAEVVAEIKKRVGNDAVFYDHDFEAQLARPNLDTLLQKIYLNNSNLIVVFLSNSYDQKVWCGVEWRAIREIIKNKNDNAIMFMKFDDAVTPGLMSLDGYIDLRTKAPIEAARLIAERVRLNDMEQSCE